MRGPFRPRAVQVPDRCRAAALSELMARSLPPGNLDETPIAPGLRFRLDPEAGVTGTWESPRGWLVHLRTGPPARPARWLGLHLELPGLSDLGGVRWVGVFARLQAGRPVALRLCLRSGRPAAPQTQSAPDGGFQDTFFARHLLAEPAETDHCAALALDRLPDVPTVAAWRELVVFLPSTEPLDLVLHDLRLIVR